MRHYETIFLLKPTLTQEETKNRIDFFKKLVTDNGGEIHGTDDIGIRHLAYEVKHNKRGYYYVIYYIASNTAIVQELQRVFRITEDVLKFMTVKFTKQVEIKAWKEMAERKAKLAEAKSEEKIEAKAEEKPSEPITEAPAATPDAPATEEKTDK